MYGSAKMTLAALALYALAFLVLFVAWFALVEYPPTDAEQGKRMTEWIVGTLGLLVGHVFTIVPTGGGTSYSAAPPNASPAGLAALPAILVAVALSLAVCACTTTAASLYAGAEAAAVKGVKATDDNLVVTLRAAVCGLPYSAVQRDATMAAAVDVLCGPLPRSTGAVLASMSSADLAAVLTLARAVGQASPGK